MGRPSQAWWRNENIGKYTLIPVQITDKVTRFMIGSKSYYPGDIAYVPEQYICEEFMVRVKLPAPEPIVEEPIVEEPVVSLEEPPQLEQAEAEEVVEEPPKRSRRRSE